MNVQEAAAWVAGIAAGGTGLGWIVGKASRGWRRVGHLIDDLVGEPARDGVPARPSLMLRIGALEETTARVQAEVTHNGGGSLKDAVARIEDQLGRHVAMPHVDPAPSPDKRRDR